MAELCLYSSLGYTRVWDLCIYGRAVFILIIGVYTCMGFKYGRAVFILVSIFTDKVVVKFGVSLIQFVDVDEKEQSVEMRIWERYVSGIYFYLRW